MMDFLQLAKTRCSIRSYKDKKIEQEKLDKILEAARVAPTAANRQPVRLIVVQEKSGLEKISKGANLYGAPLAILVCVDHDITWTRTFDGKKTTDIDASIITDHMMLEATDLELGSLWICSFKHDLLKQEFCLPSNLEIVNILAIGYAAQEWTSPDRHTEARYPLENMVFYESITS